MTSPREHDLNGAPARLPWLDVVRQDLRFTFRTMRRDPAFTLIAVLILSLGIGANVAVFSVVNTILLRPLPFPNSQQLVRIVEKNPAAGESSKTYSADATEDIQQQNRSYQSVSGYFAFTGPDNFKLIGRDQPVPLTGILVAQGFFQTLAVEPALGRLFKPAEFAQHAAPVTLLTYPIWKSQFGGDPAIVGKTIDVNNTSVTVIGVLPQTFDFGAVFSPGAKVDLFAPYIMDDFRDDGNDLALVARLKPGVTVGQAQREADQLIPNLYFSHKHTEYGKGYGSHRTEGICQRQVTPLLDRSLVRGRSHSAHCLRQFIESPLGPRRRPQQRICHAYGPRCRPRPPRAAISNREFRARRRRGRRRSRPQLSRHLLSFSARFHRSTLAQHGGRR